MRKAPVRLLATCASILALLLAACGSASPGSSTPSVKIGLVTDIGGLNDKSFNHLAAIGLSKAASTGNICSKLSCKGELGVQGDVTESHNGTDYVPNLTNYATRGYNLVIGVGFSMAAAIGTVSGQFPNVHFAIVDGVGTDDKGNDLKHSNVLGLLFKEQEAGALVGVIAGVLEKDGKTAKGKNTIGSVGGVQIPPVDHYIAGYQWAAKQVDPGIKVLNGYSNNFTDPSQCSGIAAQQISQGADIVFQVAGGCGNGVLTEAGKQGVWSIGVDSDQGYPNGQLVDKSVIASALKRVDVAVYSAIKQVKNGQFSGGVSTFSLSNDGVGYVIDSLSPVPADVTSALNDMISKIKSGSVTVPCDKPFVC